MKAELTLPITPKALPRARHSAQHGFVRSYYKKDTLNTFDDYEIAILKALNNTTRTYTQEICKNVPKGLYITLHAIFYMPIPNSWSGKRKLAVELKPHTKKPDVSNLLKMLEDRANGILYPDDSYIYKATCEKVYSKHVGIFIRLEYNTN